MDNNTLEQLKRELCNPCHPDYNPDFYKKVIRKPDFFKELWVLIDNFLNQNAHNKIVAGMMQRYPNFLIRAYTILAIFFGARTKVVEPEVREILLELVGLFGEDLDAKMEKMLVYAANKDSLEQHYFLDTYRVWQMIENVYKKEDNPFDLPLTPLDAFALLTLSVEEIYSAIEETVAKELRTLHDKADGIITGKYMKMYSTTIQ